MCALAMVLFGSGFAVEAVKLPSDVIVFEGRQFAFPVSIDDEWLNKTKQLRLFVSEDRGKTWKHEVDFAPTADKIVFDAREDGLYWFAVQIVFKDGKSEPADLKNLRVDRKVFVNTSGKPVLVQKGYSELQKENEELRKRVSELEKQLSERRPK